MRGLYHLVVLRHGQSEWNAAGIFTGWENAHLTGAGEEEAIRAGTLLAEYGGLPAFVHTSLQRRTTARSHLALTATDRDWFPVRRSWRLNGRHYGALQGRTKAQVLQEYWERHTVSGAGPITPRRRRSARRLRPFRPVIPATRPSRPRPGPTPSPSGMSPRGCCPIGTTPSAPDLRACGCVLVVSHGNTLRALVKHLELIPDYQIADLDIPTGTPLVYELGPDMRPDAMGGQYLDPHAARDAIEAFRNQGRALARP